MDENEQGPSAEGGPATPPTQEGSGPTTPPDEGSSGPSTPPPESGSSSEGEGQPRGRRFVSSSDAYLTLVERTNQDEVDSFQIAYKDFKQTNKHSYIFKCIEPTTKFIDDHIE
ncbi:unnamed protein product, partial [Callosobruchus maculatus]